MVNSSSTSESPATSITAEIRGVLFGDEPLEKIGAFARYDAPEAGDAPVPDDGSFPGIVQDDPWACFAEAARLQANADLEGAVLALRRVLQISALEMRVYLQAWHCLRGLGQQPPERLAGEVQGVVVEVALDRGLDIVTVYADGSARYLNYSGAAILWDSHDVDIDRLVVELLAVGQSVADVTEVWDGPRPSAPETGTVRINILTFGGLHLIQGSFQAVMQDGLGGLALRGAFDLMQALVSKVKAKHPVS